jgi:hypothetical protein
MRQLQHQRLIEGRLRGEVERLEALDLRKGCEWIEKRQNCIALGPSGTGKTHVALALGLAACQKGYSVAFTFDKDGAQQALFPYNDPGQLPITPLTSLSPPRLRMVNGTRTVRAPAVLARSGAHAALRASGDEVTCEPFHPVMA